MEDPHSVLKNNITNVGILKPNLNSLYRHNWKFKIYSTHTQI